MRAVSVLVLIAFAALPHALAACAPILSPQQGGILINKIQLGMSRNDVVEQLGQPHKQETQGPTEFLFYNTNWVMTDAASQRSPIAIKDDKVVGFGKSYYETFVKGQTSKADWHGEVISSKEAERAKP
jgi:hypothetical protein